MALLPEHENEIFLKIKYVIALDLQIQELKKIIRIGITVAEILNVKARRNQQLWKQLSFYFHYFF